MEYKDLNLLKVVQVKKKNTNKWLCEQFGVYSTTISKWCTNSSWPSVSMVFRLMEVLEVDNEQVINIPKKHSCKPMFHM